LGSFQTAGSSSDALTVLRRSDFASKSKIPPEIGRAGLQVLQGGADQVDAFCVHFSSILRGTLNFRISGGPSLAWRPPGRRSAGHDGLQQLAQSREGQDEIGVGRGEGGLRQ